MKDESDRLGQHWIQGLYQEYRRRRRSERRLVTGVQTAILVFLFGLWEIAGRVKWID
ncbi:ABC transporter permease, partial [Paenibacillus sp. 28ISP30-2]|nr:ABC transporter permease [Paenibacillus sp. 28ISP30-2]